ncbi:MAG: BTAD domain-containing putative transcriptional regulator [Anaerolineae bacterium]
MLRIHLLGTPHIFTAGEPMPLPAPPKALLLWAYLLLKRERPVPREQLAYIIWPDETEAEARANLRRHLHLLRKQLPAPPQGTDWILATRSTLQWNSDATYWLDVTLLDQFVGETASEEQWTAVVDCYRGDLLEGFYDDWVLAERSRLRQRYIHILEQRIALQKAGGDLRGAIRTTQRLLARDHLREEPYRYLMELYYRLGDRAAALREFEKCQVVLHTELETEPMPETLALRDAIRDGLVLEPLPTLPPVKPSLPAPTHPVHQPARRRSIWLWAGAALIFLSLAGLFAAGALPPHLYLQPITTSISGPDAVQDTWIDEENGALPYDPNEPGQTLKASYPQVHLMFFNYPYDRVLIRFDLTQLPSDAKIRQTVFNIHLADYVNEDLPKPLPATVSVFRILRPWQAETATFNSPWSEPGMAAGVDYDEQPLGSHSFHGATWISVDVTDLAQEWLAYPDRNQGLMLMITEAPQGAHYWVDTTDYPILNRRPRLDLTYTH